MRDVQTNHTTRNTRLKLRRKTPPNDTAKYILPKRATENLIKLPANVVNVKVTDLFKKTLDEYFHSVGYPELDR